MKKYLVNILAILLVIIFIGKPVNVFAGENNGEPRKDSGMFCNSGCAMSYKGDNVKFYDFAIPYAKTVEEIGGLADGVDTNNSTYNYTAYGSGNTKEGYSSQFYKHKTGQFFQQEWSSLGTSRKFGDNTYTIHTDSDTDCPYVEVGSNKVYFSALPATMFEYSGINELGFYSWVSFGNTGILFDMILDDGTMLHFAAIDGIGHAHSNQDGEFDGWTAESQESAQDNTRYHTTKLNYPHYDFLFQAASTHSFEISGNPSKFMQHYGLNAFGEGEHTIQYVRIYNISLADLKGATSADNISGFMQKSTINENTEGLVYATANSGVSSAMVQANFIGGYYTEASLSQFSKLCESNLMTDISVANKDKFKGDQLTALETWERQITEDSSIMALILKTVRGGIQLLGILLMLWALFMYVGFWFDRINTFIEINMVQILTLGKLKTSLTDTDGTYSLTKEDKGKKEAKTITHRNCVFICLVALTVGIVILTGTIYKLLLILLRAIWSVFK